MNDPGKYRLPMTKRDVTDFRDQHRLAESSSPRSELLDLLLKWLDEEEARLRRMPIDETKPFDRGYYEGSKSTLWITRAKGLALKTQRKG